MYLFKKLACIVLFVSMFLTAFSQRKRTKNQLGKSVLKGTSEVSFSKNQQGILLSNTSKKFQSSFYEALSLRLIKKHKKALEYLSKCENIYPNHIPEFLSLEISKNYKAQENYSKAQEYLQKALQTTPEQTTLLLELQEVLNLQKKYVQSIEILKQLVSKNSFYNYTLAKTYLDNKAFTKALQSLNTYQEIHPYDTERIEKLRVGIYQKMPNKELIYKDLDLKIAQNPNDPKYYLKAIEVCENIPDTQKTNTYSQLFKNRFPNSEYLKVLAFNDAVASKDVLKAETLLKTLQNSYSITEKELQKATANFYRLSQKTTKEKYVSTTTHIEDHWQRVKEIDLDAKDWLLKLDNDTENTGNLSQKSSQLKQLTATLEVEPYNFKVLKKVLLLEMALKKYTLTKDKIIDALEAFPTQPLFYLIATELNLLDNTPEKAVTHLINGIQYLIDAPKLEYVFYQKLANTYTDLKQPKKAKHFKTKAENLK